MSVIQDPETYERFEKVVLVHGVRYVNEVAYREFITELLPQNEFFGDAVREKLIYYPTVTREPFENQGRLTDLMRSGKLFSDIGLPPINPQDDRAMICGSPSMLDETSEVLDSFGEGFASHGRAWRLPDRAGVRGKVASTRVHTASGFGRSFRFQIKGAQHFLNFSPLSQGQGSLRPAFSGTVGSMKYQRPLRCTNAERS